MVYADRLTSLTLDASDPRSLAARWRGRRSAEMLCRFPQLESMEVLDLGGRPGFWREAPVRPHHVVIVNIDEFPTPEPWLSSMVADACSRDRFSGMTFDLVVSNSTIEHLGGRDRRSRFAEVVHAVSDRWWVQTPYRYFPIEPHWLFPGFQFLPESVRVAITRTWPLGNRRARTQAEALDRVREVELLSATELRRLFPEGELWKERVAGLVKSLVAVRG